MIKLVFHIPEIPLNVEAEIEMDADEFTGDPIGGSERPNILGVSVWGTSLKMDLIPPDVMTYIGEQVMRAHRTKPAARPNAVQVSLADIEIPYGVKAKVARKLGCSWQWVHEGIGTGNPDIVEAILDEIAEHNRKRAELVARIESLANANNG